MYPAATPSSGNSAAEATQAAASSAPQSSPSSGGPRTLSGAPADSSAPWPSQPATNTGSRKPGAGFSASGGSRGGGIATLRDYRDEQPAPKQRSGNNDDDDKDPENLYAGGERSGLSIQNPGRDHPDVVRDILERARRTGAGEFDDEEDASPGPSTGRGAAASRPGGSAFSGAGRSLAATGPTPDAAAAAALADADQESDEADAEDEVAERNVTFWQDGFSIGDGPLWPYGDERSKIILDQIQSGTAPLALFNAKMGQRIVIQVANRKDEAYRPPPPPPMQPFGGSGNRLGSPAPSAGGNSTSAAAPPAATSSSTSASSAAPTVDSSQPVTSLQIRTANGSRLTAKFNHTHTVADVRSYIDSADAASQGRAYTLHTSFPPKLIENETQTLKDAGLINAVVIQKHQ